MKKGYKQTDVGVIPEEWEVKRIGELFEVTAGRDFRPKLSSLEQDEQHPFPVYSNAITARGHYGYCSYSDHEPHTITVTARGTLGVANYRDHQYTAIGRVLVLRPQFTIDGRFFAEFINARMHFVVESTGVPQLTAPQISRYEMPLPPLPEQRAIATALGDVDALITGLEELLRKKRDVKQATMQQLLTGKQRLPGFGTKSDNKQTNLGSTPEDWTVQPLLNTVRIATGQVDPRVEPYVSMVLVAPDHIESGTGRLLEIKTAAEQGAISGKYLFNPGDVIYSKIRPYLQKAFVANFRGLCSADMYPLSPTDSVSEFILATLLGKQFTEFATAVSARSGIPKINRDELAEYVLAVPPIAEQTAIATVLSDMDAEIVALEKRLEKTRALKQGMMQELLTGRTRLG